MDAGENGEDNKTSRLLGGVDGGSMSATGPSIGGGESGAPSADVEPDPALPLSATGPLMAGGEERSSESLCDDIRCDCVDGGKKSVEYTPHQFLA